MPSPLRTFYVALPVGRSRELIAKINSKHGITEDEIDAVCVGFVQGRWDIHPLHGRRVLIYGTVRPGRRLKVILQPVDVVNGVWRLRTAIVAKKGEPS